VWLAIGSGEPGCICHVEHGLDRASGRARRSRLDRLRQAIRSILAGVFIAALTGTGVAFADVAQYTVQPGDTLNDVAVRHGVSPAELIRANDLANGDELQIGQVLRLPNGVE